HTPLTLPYSTLSLHDALPIFAKEFHPAIGVVNDEPLARAEQLVRDHQRADGIVAGAAAGVADYVCVAFAQSRVPGGIEPGVHARSEEHTSELQSRGHLVCRLL